MTSGPDDLSWWRGRLRGYERGRVSLTLRAPLGAAKSSGAEAFLGADENGDKWWVKLPGNPQGTLILVNEVLVGELGALIGAPVRERALIAVRQPDRVRRDLELRSVAGGDTVIAHASRMLENALDSDSIDHAHRGDNRRRIAALAILWDWCLGDDPQWLYDTESKFEIWSHDHGFWFFSGEADWDAGTLVDMRDLAARLPVADTMLSAAALEDVARELDRIHPEQLLSIAAKVPVEWGLQDSDLEAMCWFSYYRRDAIENRAYALAAEVRRPRGGHDD